MYKNISDGFTINMTNSVRMPDVDYINELAIEKNFSLSMSFHNPPKILQDLYYLFRKEGEDPETFELKNHLFSRAYMASDLLFRELTPEESAYYKYTLLFLEKIDFSSVIGITPLDKSLNVMMYLVHLSSKTNPKKNSGNQSSDPTHDPENSPVQVQDDQALGEAMQEMQNFGSGDDGVVRPPDGNDELSDDITQCVRDHLYDLTPSIANIYGAKKPSDVAINRKMLGDIKIKAYLENTQGLTTSKDSKKVQNNDSTDKENYQMESHNQITKVKKSSMMMDNFDDKFIKKELVVSEKVKPVERKQILYMLLDDSGSMSCKVKQTYVRAVLLNRLEAVVDGKAELKFCLYESKRYNFHEVKDIKASQKLYKEISLKRPRGGGTYIGNVLQETINEIHNLPGYHEPEIMIVCDGDDHVDPDSLDYKGVRINAVLLGTVNPGLERIAQETGGFFTCEKLYGRH